MVCQRTGIRATGGRDFNLPLYLYLYLTNISVPDKDKDKYIYIYIVVPVPQRDKKTHPGTRVPQFCPSSFLMTKPSFTPNSLIPLMYLRTVFSDTCSCSASALTVTTSEKLFCIS